MPLDLLPTSGLELSVLVAVLVGTLVLFYLSEAFGWSFGGLVVPGYLASVLVVSPAAGVTVIAEAVLTLLVVVALSDGLARTGIWSAFFGRERFLLLVVVSILVRQAAEIWLWPAALAHQVEWFGSVWLQPGEAHSVGLVLVPLTANALGKGTRGNGLAQLVVPTFLAWLVLTEVLFARTNLSLSAMSLTYEDVSLDFLGSARAYIVLAAGAWLATRFNGAFAWSAGGILVPALLGLAWYEPTRVFATIGEAVAIAFAYRGISRLPVVRFWNLEGARKLAILFVLSTSFRVGLAWIHELGIPVHTNEWSGLGYLLSALLAAKILQFGSTPTAVLPLLGTSLLAFGGGSVAAYALEQVFPVEQGTDEADPEPVTLRLTATPAGAVEYARIRTRLDTERAPPVRLPATRLSRWRQLWREIDAGVGAPDFAAPAAPGAWLVVTPGAGTFADRPWWIVHEAAERLDDVEGWGVGLVRPGATGPALVVERAWSDAASAGAAVARCAAVDCAILYVSGMELPTGTDDARVAWSEVVTRPVERVAGDALSAANVSGEATEQPDARGVGDLVAEAIVRAPERWSASATELAYLTNTLVPTLDAWADGEATLDAVRGRAALVELDVASVLGGGDRPALVLTPRRAGPIVVVRRAGTATLVAANHPVREVGTLKLALGAFDSLDARVLLLDPAEDPAAVEAVRDPLQALSLGWRRALEGLPGDGAVSLWFRGLGAGEPGAPRPGEDVVIGTGVPLFTDPPAPLAAIVESDHWSWSHRWAAGGVDEPGLAGNHLAGLQADRVFGGVTPAVLWFSGAARDKWRSEDRATVAEWVAAAGLSLVDGDGTAPLPPPPALAGASRGAAEGRFPALADLARRAAHQHNLNLLRKLVDSADRTVSVTAGWDTARLLPWIDVQIHAGTEVWAQRAWLVPGDGREVVLPADATAAEIRSAVGWMPADLSFRPVAAR